MVAGLLVAGIGVGLGYADPRLGGMLGAVPQQLGGMAAGAVNTMRQLGYALGIAGLGSVFAARVGHVVADQGGRPAVLAQAISGGQAQRLLAGLPAAGRDALDQVVHAASAAGLNAAFLLARGARPGRQRDRAGRDAPPAIHTRPRPASGGRTRPGSKPAQRRAAQLTAALLTPAQLTAAPHGTPDGGTGRGATPQSTGATEGAPV